MGSRYRLCLQPVRWLVQLERLKRRCKERACAGGDSSLVLEELISLDDIRCVSDEVWFAAFDSITLLK